ncbi:MAG: class I SAM-dependent methyltransferase [Chitinophagales bacterium]
MNVLLHRIFSGLQYQWKAQSQYYLHSPFAFQFYQNALLPARSAQFPKIEHWRQSLLHNHTTLPVVDFGAGGAGGTRTIRQLCANTAIPAKYGALLHHSTRHFQPAVVVELGTSLGLSTAYMASALPNSRLISFEGNPAIAGFTGKQLAENGWPQIEIVTGNFDDTLQPFLRHHSIDFAFIDGNHRYEPTVRYFEWLLKASHPDTVLVFDDIYWSPEMTRAWNHIKAHPATRTTFDFWRMGFVFLRREMLEKQHFILRY